MNEDRLHEGPHSPDGPEECFGCRVKTFTVNPYSTPSRLNPHTHPKPADPAWERGVPTDNRGMPFLDRNGHPMGAKKVAENRHVIAESKRAFAHNSTT